MGTEEQDREIAGMVRDRSEARREHACLENKLQRMRDSIMRLQLGIAKSLDIRAEGEVIVTSEAEQIEWFTASDIAQVCQRIMALNAKIASLNERLDRM